MRWPNRVALEVKFEAPPRSGLNRPGLLRTRAAPLTPVPSGLVAKHQPVDLARPNLYRPREWDRK